MYSIFESIDGPAKSTRVIIVGGGAAGLSALSAMKKTPGVHALLLEKQSDIGGVWKTSNYPKLATHIKSYAYRFHDFRPPECETEYATRNEVLQYFSDYAEDSDFKSNIITGVEARTITCSTGVEIEVDRSNGETFRLYADFVVCALGFANAGQPNIPNFQGADSFNGEIIHSSQLTTSMLDRIKSEKLKTVLLGGGKSAYDLAVLFQQEHLEAQTTWIYRKFLWGLNHEMVYSNDPSLMEISFLSGQFFHRQRRTPNHPEVIALAQKIRDSGLYLNLDDTLGIHQFRGAHYSKQEIDSLRQNAKRIISSVTRLDESTVYLENGDKVQADLVICATGYNRGANLPTFQIVNAGETRSVDPCEQSLLYRAMVDPRLPRVLFFTGESTFPSHLYGFSISSRWLPHYMRKFENGELTPSEMNIQTDIDENMLNGGVDPNFKYSWIPDKNRNLSGGYDYSALEASTYYRSQIYTDLQIPKPLQAQVGFSLFQSKSFEIMNESLHLATKDLPPLFE